MAMHGKKKPKPMAKRTSKHMGKAKPKPVMKKKPSSHNK